MKVVEGNLLESDADIIVQQVNCMGAMNSGVAKQIREKYPVVYSEYKRMVNEESARSGFDYIKNLIGKMQYIHLLANENTPEEREVIIANAFAQEHYGRSGGRFTDYDAFQKCMMDLSLFVHTNNVNMKIAFPYKIGCGLGGGDWRRVSRIIEDTLFDLDVWVYKLPEERCELKDA